MNVKKKYTDLFKNIGILTFSNFGSKLLGFFLVPLYTSVLSTVDYGSYDFIYTTISLLLPVLTLNISEAALRFLLDKNEKNTVDICNITFRFTIVSILITLLLVAINYYFKIINIINSYWLYFIIFYVVSVFLTMLQNIARGFDQIKKLAISGIINSTLILFLNILFLVVFKLGLNGYFLASIISNFVAIVYLLISTKFIKNINLKNTNKKLEKEMTNYSKPLMLNSISWWINNASDRYVVTFLCGIAANGIYSVAYKIPSILSVFQTIFNQAWGISAVKEFDKNDEDNFFKNIYLSYNLLLVILCSLLIICSKILARFLCMNEFYISWKYTPFLIISVVFGALSGLLGGAFSAVKDSKTLGFTTVLGAIINIILNFVLIYLLGVIGAAIATFISYFVVWLVRVIKVKKYIVLRINLKKDFMSYLILIIQTLILLNINNIYWCYSIEIILFLILVLINKNDLDILKDKIKGGIKNG